MSDLAQRVAADRGRPLGVRLAAFGVLLTEEGCTVAAEERCKGGYRLHCVTADGRPFTLRLDPQEG